MKVAVLSAHSFEVPFLEAANKTYRHELVYFPGRLTSKIAKQLVGFPVVSCFVLDTLNAEVLKILAVQGVKLIALRSAGFNHVDLAAAKTENLMVTRVPCYSPYAIAEFAVGLILCLNRHIHQAYNQVQKHNFALDGLLGFDLQGKTVGVIGTGAIGSVFANIMLGFGCRVLATDLSVNSKCEARGVHYVPVATLYQEADIISLHCPLTEDTHHLINQQALDKMKRGVMLINTSRGAVLDTVAVIAALESGKIAYLGMDVYEKESNLFFQDLSKTLINDELFLKLQSFSNVLITGHQAFFTREALTRIAQTTLESIEAVATGLALADQTVLVA